MSLKATTFPNPSRGGRARQSEKDACDVNLIVAHHRRGGVSTHLVNKVASFGYVPSTSFLDNMLELRRVKELFMELPAATRKFFLNDPAHFVEYASNPENVKKLVELGLAVPRDKPFPPLGSAENPVYTVTPAPPA